MFGPLPGLTTRSDTEANMQAPHREWHMLATRVARLEKENRRLKRAGGLLAALGAVVILGGQAARPADVVEASEFRVVDAEGKVRAWLSLRDDEWSEGDVALGFLNEDGELKTALGVIGGHPRLQFGTEQEAVLLALGLRGTISRPFMEFIGHNDVSAWLTTRMELRLGESDAPALRFWGSDGELEWEVPLGQTGAATEKISARSFVLVDDMDRRFAELSHEEGSTGLSFYDDAGRERMTMALGARGGQLVIDEPDAEHVIRLGPHALTMGSTGLGALFETTGSGFQWSSRWEESDRDRPDAFLGLGVPKDDLSYGPDLTLSARGRGDITIGLDQDGWHILISGRRIYFGRDGQVLWEPEQ